MAFLYKRVKTRTFYESKSCLLCEHFPVNPQLSVKDVWIQWGFPPPALAPLPPRRLCKINPKYECHRQMFSELSPKAHGGKTFWDGPFTLYNAQPLTTISNYPAYPEITLWPWFHTKNQFVKDLEIKLRVYPDFKPRPWNQTTTLKSNQWKQVKL